MVKITYKCSWCKTELSYHPRRFDFVKYHGVRSYQTEYHFDFCDDCFKKISKFIKENEIKGRRVKKVAPWRQ